VTSSAAEVIRRLFVLASQGISGIAITPTTRPLTFPVGWNGAAITHVPTTTYQKFTSVVGDTPAATVILTGLAHTFKAIRVVPKAESRFASVLGTVPKLEASLRLNGLTYSGVDGVFTVGTEEGQIPPNLDGALAETETINLARIDAAMLHLPASYADCACVDVEFTLGDDTTVVERVPVNARALHAYGVVQALELRFARAGYCAVWVDGKEVSTGLTDERGWVTFRVATATKEEQTKLARFLPPGVPMALLSGKEVSVTCDPSNQLSEAIIHKYSEIDGVWHTD
jgi:hypothetical protein